MGANSGANKLIASPSDLRGLSRLGFDAAVGITDLVEQMHHTISRRPFPLGEPVEGPARGITGFVYRSVRGVMRLAGHGVDAAWGLFGDTPPPVSSPARDMALAVLNGVVGDRLVETGNPLALDMRLRHAGQPLTLEREQLAQSIAAPTGRLLVLVHGLCMNDLQWTRNDHDHGASLARDFGFTPVYLFYNTGLHVSENGRMFADMLERLVAEWPVPIEDFVILGHSMGGLVARSACHYGERDGRDWRRRLRKLVFLGTPHHGAPLERIGSWIDLAIGRIPYTAAFNRLGKIRSAGVTDLRYGALIDEDWQGRDRFERTADPRAKLALPDDVACYAVAATMAETPGGVHGKVLADGLVPLASALGQHADPERTLAIPEERRAIVCETGHLDLLSSQEVYGKLTTWLGPVC
jgi:pimeloyl-ACP methyl ester carboxylesterase